jgi:hypothetical protein
MLLAYFLSPDKLAGSKDDLLIATDPYFFHFDLRFHRLNG